MTNLDSGDAPAMPAAPLVARSTIRMGATGDAVRQIQIALKVIGYTHTIRSRGAHCSQTTA